MQIFQTIHHKARLVSLALALLRCLRFPIQKGLVRACDPVPKDGERAIAAYIVRVMEVVTLRPTLESKHVKGAERKAVAGVSIDSLQQADK